MVALAPGPKRRLTPGGQPITDTAVLAFKDSGPDSISLNTDRTGSVPRPYRGRWAELLKHIFDHDVLVCDRCAGRMVPVQTVDSPVAIGRILTHLGLPATLPQPASARAPPQQIGWEFESDFDDAFDQSG